MEKEKIIKRRNMITIGLILFTIIGTVLLVKLNLFLETYYYDKYKDEIEMVSVPVVSISSSSTRGGNTYIKVLIDGQVQKVQCTTKFRNSIQGTEVLLYHCKDYYASSKVGIADKLSHHIIKGISQKAIFIFPVVMIFIIIFFAPLYDKKHELLWYKD